MINAAATQADGWDAVTMNPAMICGPLLFEAMNGQWIKSIGELAAGTFVGDDRSPPALISLVLSAFVLATDC